MLSLLGAYIAKCFIFSRLPSLLQCGVPRNSVIVHGQQWDYYYLTYIVNVIVVALATNNWNKGWAVTSWTAFFCPVSVHTSVY